MRPASTDIPAVTLTSFTRPARGALSSFSIFIASTTTTPWRADNLVSRFDEHTDHAAGHGGGDADLAVAVRAGLGASAAPAVDGHTDSTSLEADQQLTGTGPGRQLEVRRRVDASHCPLFATAAVTGSGFFRQQQEAELGGPGNFDDLRHAGDDDPKAPRAVHALDRDRERPAIDLDLQGHGRSPSWRARCVHALRVAPGWPSRPALARR